MTMSDYRVIRNASNGAVILPRAYWCADFMCHLKGLMFRRVLPADEGLLFVYDRESKMDTSIHMFFVGFPIATIWLDTHQVVVDKVLAKPWRPYYASSKPAQYFIEANPPILDRVEIGAKLLFEPLSE